MTEYQMRWDQKLTDRDFRIYGELWGYLKARNLSCFTCDDIREAFKKDNQFEEYFPNPGKDVGAFLAKCKMGHLIIDTNQRRASGVESNHRRKVIIFRMRGLQDLWESNQQQQVT